MKISLNLQNIVEIFNKIFNKNNLKLKENNDIRITRNQDKTLQIIKESQYYLKELQDLKILTIGFKFNDLFKKISDISCKIHDECVSNKNIPIKRLREFNEHYTNQFILTFKEILNPIFPKKNIPSNLTSDYLINSNKTKKLNPNNSKKSFFFERLEKNNSPLLNYDKIKFIYNIEELDIANIENDNDKFLYNMYGNYISDIFNLKEKTLNKIRENPKYRGLNLEYELIFLGVSNKNEYPYFIEHIYTNSDNSNYKLFLESIFKLDLESKKKKYIDLSKLEEKYHKEEIKKEKEKGKDKEKKNFTLDKKHIDLLEKYLESSNNYYKELIKENEDSINIEASILNRMIETPIIKK